jgi:hypothetical protein
MRKMGEKGEAVWVRGRELTSPVTCQHALETGRSFPAQLSRWKSGAQIGGITNSGPWGVQLGPRDRFQEPMEFSAP